MKSSHLGVLAFLGFSLAWMGLAAHWLTRKPAAPTAASADEIRANEEQADEQEASEREAPALAAPTDTHRVSDVPNSARRAEALARRLAELLGGARGDEDELSRIEAELLALGEGAAAPLVAVIKSERDSARRDRLLDILRKVPGSVAEAGLIEEARSGRTNTSRSIAIEGLGERRTPTAIEALDHIARTDPELPRQPLITAVLDYNDTTTELPDEMRFTPRMHAMAALASTEDPRAMQMLMRVLREEREESLRMEAATDLAKFNKDHSAVEALANAASTDLSIYVRIAALHSLAAVPEPALLPILERIAKQDSHAGVRILAGRILTTLRAAIEQP